MPSSGESIVSACCTRVWRPAAEHPPQRLLADAGYDADWIHSLGREDWGVESLIKAVVHRKDGLLGGTFRKEMTPAV
jgi:hypothetical protein